MFGGSEDVAPLIGAVGGSALGEGASAVAFDAGVLVGARRARGLKDDVADAWSFSSRM